MKKNEAHILIVKSRSAPIVEIDTEAQAAYVRFKKAKVAKTLRHRSGWPIVTIDLDAHGDVIGVEFIGVRRFNLQHLLKHLPIRTSRVAVEKASYVAPACAN